MVIGSKSAMSWPLYRNDARSSFGLIQLSQPEINGRAISSIIASCRSRTSRLFDIRQTKIIPLRQYRSGITAERDMADASLQARASISLLRFLIRNLWPPHIGNHNHDCTKYQKETAASFIAVFNNATISRQISIMFLLIHCLLKREAT